MHSKKAQRRNEMAIDFTKMAGYKEGMTAEDKLGLLTNYEPPMPDLSGYIKKDSFDKTASELAEAKKTFKGKTDRGRAERSRERQHKPLLRRSLKN